MTESISFAEEIEANIAATKVSSQVARLETPGSCLDVRLRGAYITKCELTSPSSGRRVNVLYSDTEIEKPKISATHPMVPAGPYDGIGGQHGFPRWADYDVRKLPETAEGEQQMTFGVKRADAGMTLSKTFVLTDFSLTTVTAIKAGGEVENTSLGEHIYFLLEDENLVGLVINGQSLDELLGEGSEATVRSNGTLFYNFGGEAEIVFPAGHIVKISASFQGETRYPLAMWIWKRPGSPSICFEPVVGVKGLGDEDNSGVTVGPDATVELQTRIDLL